MLFDQRGMLRTRYIPLTVSHQTNRMIFAATSGGKVKSKEKGAATDQKCGIDYYFRQLTGCEEPDIKIVGRKLASLLSNVSTIADVSEKFASRLYEVGYHEYAKDFNDFRARALSFKSDSNEAESSGLNGKAWKSIKEHDFVHTCMVTCANLSVIYAQFIHSWDTVDRKFMNRFSGFNFTPFSPWCEVDIKYVWLIDGDSDKTLPEFLFTSMKNMFNSMREIYDLYMSPDIDVSHLSEMIISSISSLKKQIPRCENAFNKIEASARMLNTNFDGYYRDFLQTRDPNNIFTAFLSDVSLSCGDDASLILQCRKIIAFYKKNASSKIASGEVVGEKRQLFEMLLSNFNNVDKKVSELNKLDNGTVETESDGENEVDDESNAEQILEEDARDLDELMRQIENPKVLSVTSSNQTKKK